MAHVSLLENRGSSEQNETEVNQVAEIGIVVPVYNTEKYLCRCVESIFAQSFSDFELFLIDDGSTDKSGEICDYYAKSDSRVKAFHQSNQGQGAARNKALDWIYADSNCEWICFVDSDDWLDPKMLEYLYQAAKQYNSKISVCKFEKEAKTVSTNVTGPLSVRLYQPEEFYCRNSLHSVVVWGKLYHRDCFKELRFPEIRACEDAFVAYRTLFQFDTFPVVEMPLYIYFLSPQSTMRSVWKPKRLLALKAREEQMEYFKEHHYEKAYKCCIKQYIQTIAGELKELGKSDKELQKQYVKSLRKKLRKEIRIYKNQCPFSENEWIFEQAYPGFMRMYWVAAAQMHRIRRK